MWFGRAEKRPSILLVAIPSGRHNSWVRKAPKISCCSFVDLAPVFFEIWGVELVCKRRAKGVLVDALFWSRLSHHVMHVTNFRQATAKTDLLARSAPWGWEVQSLKRFVVKAHALFFGCVVEGHWVGFRACTGTLQSETAIGNFLPNMFNKSSKKFCHREQLRLNQWKSFPWQSFIVAWQPNLDLSTCNFPVFYASLGMQWRRDGKLQPGVKRVAAPPNRRWGTPGQLDLHDYSEPLIITFGQNHWPASLKVISPDSCGKHKKTGRTWLNCLRLPSKEWARLSCNRPAIRLDSLDLQQNLSFLTQSSLSPSQNRFACSWARNKSTFAFFNQWDVESMFESALVVQLQFQASDSSSLTWCGKGSGQRLHCRQILHHASEVLLLSFDVAPTQDFQSFSCRVSTFHFKILKILTIEREFCCRDWRCHVTGKRCKFECSVSVLTSIPPYSWCLEWSTDDLDFDSSSDKEVRCWGVRSMTICLVNQWGHWDHWKAINVIWLFVFVIVIALCLDQWSGAWSVKPPLPGWLIIKI